MTNHNKLLSAITFFAISLIGFAQNGNTTLYRMAWDKGLGTLENYEISSAIGDQDSYYDFLNLFENGDVLIFNDLIGSGKGNEIMVKDYADYLLNQAQNKQVFIFNIKKKRIWEENNLVKMEYEFDKAISYANKYGVFFDSNDFFGENYKMNAVVAYDKDSQKSYIEKLEGKTSSNKMFPAVYYTFMGSNDYDKDLRYNNRKIKLNRFGQAFLPGDFSSRDLTYSDPEIHVNSIIDQESRIVTTKYKVTKFTLKPHYDLAFGNALKCDASKWLTSFKTKESMCVGLDFGVSVFSKNSFKVAILTGVEYSQIKLDMGYNNSNYSYSTDADVDGNTYIRHYRDLKLSQNIKFSQIAIPIYADLSIRMSRFMGVYLNLGAKLDLNMSISNKVDGLAYIYGVYPQYGNLYLDEQWGFNNFGDMSYSNLNLAKSEIQDVNKFTLDLLGGVGIRFFIPSTQFAIDLGLKYQMGMMPLIKENPNKLNTSNESTPLVYNVVNGLSSTEKMRSMTEGLGNVKMQMLKFSIGISYKF